MSWSNFESADGRIISINMDEVVSVINYPNDQADIFLKNGCMHTVTFIGPWIDEETTVSSCLDRDLCGRAQEVQDLKLENDRLKRREELYQEFLNFLDCHNRICFRCTQYRPDDDVHCKIALPAHRQELINELKQKLEEL